MQDIHRLSAGALARAIADGRITATQAVEAALARIAALDDDLRAFALVDGAGALARAAELDRERQAGRTPGPLHGVPFSAKDLVITKGMETAFGSHTMAGNIPDWDNAAIARLKDADAILIGKTTTPEFGHKALTNSPRHGWTRNPWDRTRSPGGSSGGAAVAVATGMGPVAVSTDGAGSARIPASACGIVGLKPTLGLIPYDQATELFSNFIYLGIAARTAGDVALMLSVMNGESAKDPWSIGQPKRRYTVAADPVAGLSGLRVLHIPTMGNPEVDDDVARLMDDQLARMRDAGAVVTVFDEPFDWSKRTAYVMMRAYQRARLAHLLDTDRERMDPSMVSALEESRQMDLAEVQSAPMLRSEVFHRVQALFERADLVVTPTVAAPPPSFDQGIDDPFFVNGKQGTLRGNWYCYTSPHNVTGHPAISIPMGFSPDGLPAGFHAVAPWFGEQALIDLAAAFERLHPWAERWPGA
ncbi:glutamyl-tRNA amidotransferase subunit A [Allostella vacuolata]|nr:glutamyl-tRNA amidotransferase subunit A [Stella vacuolata]